MATKDIPEIAVLRAYAAWEAKTDTWPLEILMRETGQPRKVCLSAMDRACRHGLVEYGTMLEGGWLTDKGKALLDGV